MAIMPYSDKFFWEFVLLFFFVSPNRDWRSPYISRTFAEGIVRSIIFPSEEWSCSIAAFLVSLIPNRAPFRVSPVSGTKVIVQRYLLYPGQVPDILWKRDRWCVLFYILPGYWGHIQVILCSLSGHDIVNSPIRFWISDRVFSAARFILRMRLPVFEAINHDRSGNGHTNIAALPRFLHRTRRQSFLLSHRQTLVHQKMQKQLPMNRRTALKSG